MHLLMIDFLYKNPTLPVLLGAFAVACMSWQSQKRLTRAKHSIDLQNNYMSSERILTGMYRLAEMAKTMPSDEMARLSEIDASKCQDEKDRECLSDLRTVLNALERMSIGVRHDVYNEELLFKSYATFVVSTWISYFPYIQAKRASNGRYYENFAWLVLRWRTRLDAKP